MFTFNQRDLEELLATFSTEIREQMVANFHFGDIDAALELGAFLKQHNLGGFRTSWNKNTFHFEVYLNQALCLV